MQRKQVIITYMALRKTGQIHDDIIKWRHFPLYWLFVWGIHQSPVNSPHKGQWRGTLMLSLICAWINGWVNNRDAGDLGRHRDHYDVTVMTCGSLERTAIVTSKSIVEWNIFRVRVGLGAGWVDIYLIWNIILLSMITAPVSLLPYVYWLRINIYWIPCPKCGEIHTYV